MGILDEIAGALRRELASRCGRPVSITVSSTSYWHPVVLVEMDKYHVASTLRIDVLDGEFCLTGRYSSAQPIPRWALGLMPSTFGYGPVVSSHVYEMSDESAFDRLLDEVVRRCSIPLSAPTVQFGEYRQGKSKFES